MSATIPGRPRQFASDTYAGVCPEAWQAIESANRDHAPAYGHDAWTARATALFRELFERDCDVYFVATGTAANALALSACCQPFHSVICHAEAHIQTDECGAPEFLGGGLKLILADGKHGKVTPESVREAHSRRREVHSHQPRVLSLSQATEVGTVYSLAEVERLVSLARELGLFVHVDGARFANALATLDVSPKAATWQAGVDVLSFGGTKNGLAVGDAIVFFRPELARDFEYRRKQAGHLNAKMRFLAAGWVGLLESGAWLRNAKHANAMARKLASGLGDAIGSTPLHPIQANSAFLHLSDATIATLHERGWQFYRVAGAERFVCSWDTREEDVTAFLDDLRAVSDARQ